MDAWAIIALVLQLGTKYGPVALQLAHDIVHQLQQSDDAEVRKSADKVHEALHGDEHVRPQR